VGNWSLLLCFLKLVKQRHSFGQGIGGSVNNASSNLTFLGIFLGQVAQVGPGFIGQPVDTVIPKPPVVLVAVASLVFGQMCLDLDGP
jgi:hypothetical protein